MAESVTTEPDEQGSKKRNEKSKKIFGPPIIPSKRKFDGEDFADYRRVRIRDKPLEWTNVSGPSLDSSSPPWLDGEEFGGSPSHGEYSILNTTRSQYWEAFGDAPPAALYGLPPVGRLPEWKLNLTLYNINLFELQCFSISCNYRFGAGYTGFGLSAAEKKKYQHCSRVHPRECRRLGHEWEKKLRNMIKLQIQETIGSAKARAKKAKQQDQ